MLRLLSDLRRLGRGRIHGLYRDAARRPSCCGCSNASIHGTQADAAAAAADDDGDDGDVGEVNRSPSSPNERDGIDALPALPRPCAGMPIAPFKTPHLSPSSSSAADICGLLRTFGISRDGCAKILSSYPQILELDAKRDISVSIILLQSVCGTDLVAECLVSWPSLLSLSKEQESFQVRIRFLLRCGFKENTKHIVKALNCLSKKSKQDLDAILCGLINHGLSQNCAYKLIRMQPTLLRQELTEITRKLDFILHHLCFSIEELFKYSSFMLCSLDSHLKPRYLMHQWVKSKRIIRRNFKLDYIMSMSEKQFRSKFVSCHPDGLRVYCEFMKSSEKKC